MATSRAHMVVPPTDENSPINVNRVADAKCSSPLVSKIGAKPGAKGGALSAKKSRKRAPREKGAFGRLLADVTNEQSKETEMDDVKFAVETQAEEAMGMANEWIREEADAKVAADLSEKLKYEDKMANDRDINAGQSEALKVAIEERRRIQAEAEDKKQMECKDREMAKKVIIDEAEEEHAFKELLSKDDEAAMRLHNELQDELLAEELMKREEAEYLQMQKKKQALIDKDAELAQKELLKEQEEFNAKEKKRQELVLQQAMKDFEVARKAQRELDMAASEAKMIQEKQDAQYALKTTIQAARDAHRRSKRLALIQSPKVFNTISKVSQQWLDADAEVEDVAGGLCLTLLLPYLRDIKVTALDRKRVDLEAYRIVGSEEQKANLATVDNSQYSAEFVIDGRNVNITNKDVSFEYSSESGLLFVYVENVHLDEEGVAGESEMGTSSGKGSSSSSSSSILNSFKRMFGGKR
jgi:hypothetical protein